MRIVLGALCFVWTGLVFAQPFIVSDEIDVGMSIGRVDLEKNGVIVKDVKGLVNVRDTVYTVKIPIYDYLAPGETATIAVRWCSTDPGHLSPCSEWGDWAPEYGGGKTAVISRSGPFAPTGLKLEP